MLNFSFDPDVYESKLKSLKEDKNAADSILNAANNIHPSVQFPITKMDDRTIRYRIVHFSGDIQIIHMRDPKFRKAYDPTVVLNCTYEVLNGNLSAKCINLYDFFETDMSEEYSPEALEEAVRRFLDDEYWKDGDE